jgi:hypothetical protein
MKIIEKLPDDPNAKPVPPYKFAIAMVVAIVIFGVAGFFVPGPMLGPLCWLTAAGLLLWLVLIGGAFAWDKRRKRHGGGDLRSTR